MSGINCVKFVWLVVIISMAFWQCSSQEEKAVVDYGSLTDDEKRSVEYAVVGLEVADDLEATLFAAEPMVANPTNMDIDHRGRVWVCEGYNYRPTLNPDNPTKKEGDRILILEDEDSDGRADKSTVFYQGNDVNAALGIWVMDNQAIVSCSPNVFILTDTDGDDMADKKEILFTGLSGEQHDHAIHAVVFGPDGKLYFNFGNAGEKILDKDGNPITEQAGIPVSAQGDPYREGMVFRCDPDGSNFEVLGHNFRNNYEVAVDSYGTLWQSDNDDDGNKGVRINYVMEYGNYGYRDEMSGENWRTYRTGMHDEIPKRHWHLNDPGVVPNLLQTGAGSPTGILVYEGDLLPKRFRNQVIHADAGPNVVRAYPVENSGAGYAAKMENIVTGKDQWFRPSDVTVAPDGSLFIADWYDPGVGGHQVGDLQQGRIYRIAPKQEKSLFSSSEQKYQSPDINLSSVEGAVEGLQNPNLSVRYLAWKTLHEMGSQAETALVALADSENPRNQARALWLLSKLDGKGVEYVEQALQSENADLRIAGIRMARQQDRDITPVLQKMVKDESPQVRREVALALRYLDSPESDKLWATLATQHDSKDRWYLEALGIGADLYAESRFKAWMNEVGDDWDTPVGRDIIWRMRSKETIPLLAELIQESEANTYPDRLRYFRAFDFHQDESKQEVLANLAVQQHPNQEEITILALNHIDADRVKQSPQLKTALQASLDNVAGSDTYVELVKRYELKEYQPALLALALEKPQEAVGVEAAKLLLDFEGESLITNMLEEGSTEEQMDLIQALKRVNSEKSIDVLQGVIANQQRPLSLRREAVMAFAGSWGGENRLLDMVRSGDLHADLDSAAAKVFSMAMRNSIYEEGALLLGIDQEASDLPPIKQLVTMQGDIAHGQTVFAQYCQNCHVVDGQGVDYGPGLSEIGDKLGKDGMYVAILEPSKGISFGYEGYNLKLNDGSQVTGYVLSKTEDEVQLRMYGGRTETYARDQIATMEEMDQSLMFDNLERSMSQEDLVSLVEYLITLKKDGSAISMN
ncbi:PVC-type heme-binding CxxCH protein [Tunicatimonas pelagia]|uniref:PVC-type heme-binding CxxCH protein n=1 Tax=Tunicatimonas pelagia TaxID=931531 RepID=UPI00266645DD|nr:PVC-type heme-binding CxxCH protein [Tunicatimonas pelagia]WKN44567.1 HEAT repeat domain-containing protein [Tunicatimonas pelagia]